MTVTRERLGCSTKGCPAPHDEEWHWPPWCYPIPGVQHSPEGSHAHWPKKGMGGHNSQSVIVANLCLYCHDYIDNGPWGNAVYRDADGRRIYRAWNQKNETLIERVLDGATGLGDAGVRNGVGDPAERGVLHEEELRVLPELGGAAPEGSSGNELGLTLSESLDLDTWADIGVQLAKNEKRRQWAWGDWLAFGEDRFGESHAQAIGPELGVEFQTLANWASVSRAWPLDYRCREIKWSYFQAAAALARENAQEALEMVFEAHAEGLTVQDFRLRLQGSERVSAPKRYTVRELMERAEEWLPAEWHQGFLAAFLSWLEEQE